MKKVLAVVLALAMVFCFAACGKKEEAKETVTVSEPIPNLTDFAEEHGTTYFFLKEANLWLRSDKLTNKAAKTYRIIIPTTEYDGM